MRPTDFFNTYGMAVVESTRGTNIFPSVKLAQMALETGYGKSIIVAANNGFGIKATPSWKGKVISNSTYEVIDGSRIRINGSNIIYPNRTAALKAGENSSSLFRVYANMADSIADHSRILQKDHFKPAMQAKTPQEQALLLEKCGYATSTSYDEHLVWIINEYDLTSWDKKKSL